MREAFGRLLWEPVLSSRGRDRRGLNAAGVTACHFLPLRLEKLYWSPESNFRCVFVFCEMSHEGR